MPARHRSIEAVLDGAWRLLEPGSAVFMQLCVFRGGFSARGRRGCQRWSANPGSSGSA